jgi:hypothetical protein
MLTGNTSAGGGVQSLQGLHTKDAVWRVSIPEGHAVLCAQQHHMQSMSWESTDRSRQATMQLA